MESLDKLWMRAMDIGSWTGCHQLPERSFFIGPYQFPICARCTGVGIGEILSIVLFLKGVRIPPITSLGLLGLMGLDWGVQRVGILSSTNFRRLCTGICGGFGLTNIYILMIRAALEAI